MALDVLFHYKPELQAIQISLEFKDNIIQNKTA